jgi:predicted O-methyltransferase YrrM
MRLAKPIHPTKLEVNPGMDPRRWKGNPAPPEVTPADFRRIFPGIEDISISTDSLPPHIRGDTNPGNLELLLKIAKWMDPETVLEIGTFRGRTTLGLLHNTVASRIVTLDLPLGVHTNGPIYGPDEEYLRTSERPVIFDPNESCIRQVFADCTDASDLSRAIERAFGASTIDFAYIDAAHTYEGVIVPFRTVLRKMSPGGIIAFDDYMKPAFAAVTEAISYLSRMDWYVFYSFAHPNPNGHGTTSTVIFINDPLCKHRNWAVEKRE